MVEQKITKNDGTQRKQGYEMLEEKTVVLKNVWNWGKQGYEMLEEKKVVLKNVWNWGKQVGLDEILEPYLTLR